MHLLTVKTFAKELF